MDSRRKIPEDSIGDIIAYRKAGATLQEVANMYGVSRERIRQVTEEEDLALVARKVRKDERKFELFAKRAEEAVACAVCGYWVLRSHQKKKASHYTCSPKCASDWAVVRYLDPEYYQYHRTHLARYMVRKGHDSSVRWGMRVLQGKARSKQQQYVREGSALHEAAQRHGIKIPTEKEYFRDGLPWETHGGRRKKGI